MRYEKQLINYIGLSIKLAIALMLISVLFATSCKTRQIKTSEKIDTSTTLSEQVNVVSTGSTTGIATGTAETNLQKNERENSYYILYFPPDSTGKQYPQAVGGSGKTSELALNTREDWEYAIESQFDYLFSKIDQLEQQVSEQQKTETKAGLTLLEKI
jgi:hypothetical protein